MESPLEQIIPPEIWDDELYRLLRDLARREPIFNALEIGSSSGEGSTAAFVDGLRQNPGRAMLFCLEASRARFDQLSRRYEHVPFVRCFNASSVSIDHFPSPEDVALFYATVPTNLCHYPLESVLGWRQDDICHIRESGIAQDGIASIKSAYGVDQFDLVLIDGSEFTGAAELEQVIGAGWIVLDDINAYKNYGSYHRLAADPSYRLVAENWNLRNGYALFRRSDAALPVHFFTIVLNGMPFMSHHIDVFRHLPFRWHWHVVEGVAELVGDTAWSRADGGHIPESCHCQGLSVDGTTGYLDELKRIFPENISIYRKPAGEFWNGKLEMVNAPLEAIDEPCLLWEIDSDECWTHTQLSTGWRMFHEEPERSAAYYWCRFFVGNRLIVNSRNCYSQMAGMEWLRTWRYRPGCRWAAHEPPRLVCEGVDGSHDLAHSRPFLNDETESRGLVFQHFAYVTADQVRFKEKYYGYSNATYHWLRLQKESDFPQRLGAYLPWVTDGTTVDTVMSQGVVPLPISSYSGGHLLKDCRIIIDAVFYQYHVTGIARVWTSLLEALSGSRFASGVVILDRGRTAPRVAGYSYLDLPVHDGRDPERESGMLQAVCDQYAASLFISTWHTSPIWTPSLLMVHDMLPELLLGDRRLEEPCWQEKVTAIERASCFVSVSENTAKDLLQWYPEAAAKPVHIMHNGVADSFRPAPSHLVETFRERYGIVKPYYLFVGPREWYKNFRVLLDAFLMLPDHGSYCIVSLHGEPLEQEFLSHGAAGSVIITGRLSEEELVVAYSGAVALVYPSRYEGFGLPLLEGMACGCPVITSTASALVEISGNAAIHVPPDDAGAFALALAQLQQQENRTKYARRGFERAAIFKWGHSASQLVRAVSGALGGQMGLDNLWLEESMPDGPASVE